MVTGGPDISLVALTLKLRPVLLLQDCAQAMLRPVLLEDLCRPAALTAGLMELSSCGRCAELSQLGGF